MDEISLEALFENIDPVLNYEGWLDNPVHLYVSGCPSILLFEVVATKILHEHEVLHLLHRAIYTETWDGPTKSIVTDHSSIVLRALYKDGFDPVALVRHNINT